MSTPNPSTTSNDDMAAIPVPVVPLAAGPRGRWILNERLQAVQRYAILSRRAGAVPDPALRGAGEFLARTERLLNFLEHELDISPAYKEAAKIDELLKFIFAKPEFHFPGPLQERARAIYEDFEEREWGSPAANEETKIEDAKEEEVKQEEGEDEETPTTTSVTAATASTTASAPAVVHIRQPPVNHPIWGANGIMHGLAVKVGGPKKTLLQDSRYIRTEKRRADVSGHNGLNVGDWFPYQLSALFHGAHGARMAGIAGNVTYGAYSIVVAETYKDVDEDCGDKITYSGPGSSTNTNPLSLPTSQGQRVLSVSVQTGNPVRVLRSAPSKQANTGFLAPAVGIRYDGLYRVQKQLPSQKNAKGGLYCSFELQRLPGQEALLSIAQRSPTAQQTTDFSRIWQLW